MKQNNKKPNLAYYTALAVGVAALAMLIGIYTYRNSDDDSDQYVDLDAQTDSYADSSLEEENENVNANVADAKNSDLDANSSLADADSTDTDTIGKSDLARAEQEGKNSQDEKQTTGKNSDATRIKEEVTSEESDTTSQQNGTKSSTATTNSTTGTENGDATENSDMTKEDTKAAKTTGENDTGTAKQENSEAGTKKSNGEAKETSLSFQGNTNLSWPVKGNVLLPFSMDTTVYYQTIDAYKSSNGMVISSKQGCPVTAAADGVVSGITKDEVYGTVVTVDIGNQYSLQYGQLTNLAVKEGDTIKKNQKLGEIAKPSDTFIVEGPNLYFSMQKNGEYVNPSKYLE